MLDEQLDYLRELAARADIDGVIELESNEVLFTHTDHGWRWLKPAEFGSPQRARLTDRGVAVLRR